ncbi:DUF4446 family protein [Candidatus Giovannonibacteria bacterium]|nr:DUF4446 family protein [Candidatus Giovannonibacteria bacterium]
MFASFNSTFAAYGFYFFIALLAVNIALAAAVFMLRKRIKNIFRGEQASIEAVLRDLRNNQDLHLQEVTIAKDRIKSLEEGAVKDLSRVGLVRHNPFSDSGGDQSFALALLNKQKNGIVVSSLYGRSINRMFAKPIDGGRSKYQLTEEEEKAIEEAVK